MPSDSSNTNVTSAAENSLGRPNFLALTGQDSPERRERLAQIISRIDEEKLEVVRVACVDTHAIVRVRAIEARLFSQAARNGVAFTTALFAMDSANSIFQNVFAADGGFGRETMGGGGDMLAVPDLANFQVLPWAHKCGWVLGDIYLKSGERCPFDPRLVMQTACARLAQQGLSYVGGIEVECHILKITDPVAGLADCTKPATAPAVGLPLRILDPEWGPGQIEISLEPLENVATADAMIILRGAVKQVCRRMGLLASFMAKPALPNVYSSGAEDGALMSNTGLHFVGGLLEHARAATAFSNPTITGYKRLNANPLAPNRVVWSHDNKAPMCRLVGGLHRAENRRQWRKADLPPQPR
jgi:glutamine synthetase